MTARRKPGPPVPDHLQAYLDECAGTWTLFDGHYVSRPHEMPAGYLATAERYIARYAVARLSAENVRAALFSFTPTRTHHDMECLRRAKAVVEQLNADRSRWVPLTP